MLILYILAIGCADLTDPPSNSEIKREGDLVIVSCIHGPEEYRLECKDTEWDGTVGTCPGRE